MPLVSSRQYGASYLFGFRASDAPVITGVAVRAAELRWESEFSAQANNSEGHAVAAVTSRPAKRKISAIFSGYLLNGASVANVSSSFFFQGRFYIVQRINDPRRKGEFVEVSIEAESFANING